MSEPAKRAKGKEEAEGSTPLLEWIAGAIGAVLFLAALAVLAAEGLATKAPPAIGARVVETHTQAGGWLVVFEAKNTGDQPAESVKFVLSLGNGEGAGERREMVIDFIGPRSSRRAGVFFTSDPGGRELHIEPQGYLEP
jgi:uncharacterized protein (TIGR02588 family)